MATNVLGTAGVWIPQREQTARSKRADRIFFSGMALLLCMLVYIGFSPSYYRAGIVRASLPSPVLHWHGAVFTLWMIVFTVQAAFIPAGKVRWHRSIGTVAFALPPVMVALGLIAAIDALRRGASIGPFSPETSLALPLIGILAFAVLMWASWRNRRRPEAHKRLILLATIGITQAAMGRFHWSSIGLRPVQGMLIGMGLLVLAVVVFDLITLRRVHRSTAWAGALTFGVAALALPIGMTHAWQAFAHWLR